MEKEIIELLTEERLNNAVRFWVDKEYSLKLLGRSENFVYEIQNHDLILRITHSSHHDLNLIKSELEWLNFLNNKNINVAKPVISLNGKYTERIETDESYFTICAFEKAQGEFVNYKNPEVFNEQLFMKMGKLTGKLHLLTKNYIPESDNKRYKWSEEDLLINTKNYINEEKVINEINSIVLKLKSIPENKDNFGLIHADIHYGNFLVQNGDLLLFDFDDSCYHYFIYDIAIILYSTIIDIKDSKQKIVIIDRFFKSFFEGYNQENKLDEKYLKLIPEILRLRDLSLYVFIYKKYNFIPLNDKQKEYFDNLKFRVKNNINLFD